MSPTDTTATSVSTASTLQARGLRKDYGAGAGLEGCGWGGAVHWGVWRPFDLSSDVVVEYAVKGFTPAA